MRGPVASLEDEIIRKGLELGFTNVGFTEVRDYPEYLQEVRSRPDYAAFTDGQDSLLVRLSQTKTRNPWAQSVVCATLGFSSADYPPELAKSIGRTYLARVYTPLEGTVHAFQIEELAACLEGLGMRVERNQFVMPQRIACAEAGIVKLANNNFAYSEQDGSFVILVTFLVDAKLASTGGAIVNDCPDSCDLCRQACPTQAILEPKRLDCARCILFNNQRFKPGAQERIWDGMGEHIHGCDVCQLVCPKNKEFLDRATQKDGFLELLEGEFDLEKVLALEDDYYDQVVHPIMYNYIKDPDIFRRNAAVALGNTHDPHHVPALERARETTENPEVLKAIDWALARIQGAVDRCRGFSLGENAD